MYQNDESTVEIARLERISFSLSGWSEDDRDRGFEMYVSKREAKAYSETIDWAIRELDRSHANAHDFQVVAIYLAVAVAILVTMLIFPGLHIGGQEPASDSGALVEERAFCPVCGSETWAVNDEIVCRDEGCRAYGLPVKVDGIALC